MEQIENSPVKTQLLQPQPLQPQPLQPRSWGLSEQEQAFIAQLRAEVVNAQFARGQAFKSLDDAEKACALAEAQLQGALRSLGAAHGIERDIPYALSPDGTRLMRQG